MPAEPKPLRGEALLERRGRRKSQVSAEQRIMLAVKRRDAWTCRVPGCHYHDLPVDACHLRHRGMGGNPKLDRTTPALLITLCRRHHGLFDSGRLRIVPKTTRGADDRCQFVEQDADGQDVSRGIS